MPHAGESDEDPFSSPISVPGQLSGLVSSISALPFHFLLDF
jgi:hypothetical protein